MEIDISVKEIGRKTQPYTVSSDLSGKVTLRQFLQFIKRAQIQIAKDVLREEQARGFDKKPRKRIDNKFGLEEEQVKPLGKIEYFSRQNVSEAILEIYKEIDLQSKRISGTYAKYNYLFYNGQIVARSLNEVTRWLATNPKFQTGTRLRFINLTPYARRLEYLGVRSGKTSRRKGKASSRYVRGIGANKTKVKVGDIVSKPNGTYFFTSRKLKRNSSKLGKFKGIANRIKFEFIRGSSIGGLPTIRLPNGQTGRTNFKRDNRPYLYPAIVLDLSSEGIL